MPAVSKAQQRLMGAAEHGAKFPEAERLRHSMTMKQLGEFARGSMRGKPEHVKRDATGFRETPAMEKRDSKAHEAKETKVRERGEHLGWDHEKKSASKGRSDSHPGLKYR